MPCSVALASISSVGRATLSAARLGTRQLPRAPL